jgi:hypothetical protein
MDKSFNDQELSDIMKEIEALEEEFAGDAAHNGDTSSVLEELSELEEEKALPKTNHQETVLAFEKKPEIKTPTPVKTTTAPASMMFKVQGNMELELQFEIGGKSVSLAVTETGLTIELENGATFSVPVSDAQSLKKAV